MPPSLHTDILGSDQTLFPLCDPVEAALFLTPLPMATAATLGDKSGPHVTPILSVYQPGPLWGKGWAPLHYNILSTINFNTAGRCSCSFGKSQSIICSAIFFICCVGFYPLAAPFKGPGNTLVENYWSNTKPQNEGMSPVKHPTGVVVQEFVSYRADVKTSQVL